MSRILKTENIQVSFGNKVVLDHVSAEFPSGAMTAVIGSNGVGKTTYLRAIARMVPAKGTISLLENGETAYQQKDIAYVPQLGALQTRLTVFEMVLLGLVNNLKWHVTEEQTSRVYELLEDLNLLTLASQSFQTLSGGQKQLVSMAQSMISRPKVLLLDEPTSALDLRHQLIVMNLAQEYTKKWDVVTIFVVHDMTLASRYGEQILVLHQGKVHSFGNVESVLTPELIAEVYGVKARVSTTEEGFKTVLPVTPL